MGLFELILIAVGLSMDAFAVAVCKGLAMRKINKIYALLIGLFFGGFQFLMPVLGWAMGVRFESYIVSIDHWIAFGLLLIIGGKMIYEAVSEADECIVCNEIKINLRELTLLAVATSIDALAVGITFAFLKVGILPAAGLIGVITFTLSLLGVVIGNRFGARYKKRAEICGGVILVLIGIKILIEHLFM